MKKQHPETENLAAGSLATGCDEVQETGAKATTSAASYQDFSGFASASPVRRFVIGMMALMSSGTAWGAEGPGSVGISQFILTYLTLSLAVLALAALIWTVLLGRATKRKLNGFTPTAFRPDFKPGRIMRVLIWCSGVHPSDLAPLSPGRHAAHAVAGLLLFVPAGMGFVALRLWLAEFAPDAPLTQMMWSAIGAALVFGVDLGCVWMLNGMQGKTTWLAMAPRAALALMLSYFITKPFVIIVYKDEVAQMQRDKKKAEVFDIANRAHEQREQFARQNQPLFERLQTRKKDLQRQLDEIGPRRSTVQSRADELHKEAVREFNLGLQDGPNKRPPGAGTHYNYLVGEKQKVEKELTALDGEEAALRATQKQLAEDEAREIARVMNDPNFAATQSAMDTVITEARQAEAKTIGRQLDLVREYVAAGNFDRRMEYWLWHILFFLLDTIPISVKFFMRKGDVQMLQSQAEKKIEARVRAEAGMAEQFEEEKAQLRHQAELRHMRLTHFREEMVILLQGAGDLILHTAQVEREVRATYNDIAGPTPPRSTVEEHDWEQVLSPLYRVKGRILATFSSIIGEHADGTRPTTHQNGGSFTTNDTGMN